MGNWEIGNGKTCLLLLVSVNSNLQIQLGFYQQMSGNQHLGLRKVRRALISVSDKTGIVELASALKTFDVEIISTGGTARVLRDGGIEVRDVSDLTGFPEMMDGRIKTLHPKIHGGLLAIRDNPSHQAAMAEHGIEPIDLVVINLYPFEETIAREGVSLEEAIEQIDIGGPAMIRSAAKNFADVAVVTDSGIYDVILAEMHEHSGGLLLSTRLKLAWAAFHRTNEYDKAIALSLCKEILPTLDLTSSEQNARADFENDLDLFVQTL